MLSFIRRAFFILDLGDGDCVHIELPPKPFTIGRSPEVDLQVADNHVSRIHCGIRDTGNDLRIRDLGSKNGTWVNGEPIQESELRFGDTIRLGHLELTLEPEPRGRPMVATEVADLRAAMATTSRIPNLPRQ